MGMLGMTAMRGNVRGFEPLTLVRDQMSDNMQPPVEVTQPEVLGELLPEEMQQVLSLKRQADNIVHQLGVHRVQEHQLIGQLRQTEGNTTNVLKVVGDRLGITDGTPWSVTSEGKAMLVGPKPVTSKPVSLVPDPSMDGEEENPEG